MSHSPCLLDLRPLKLMAERVRGSVHDGKDPAQAGRPSGLPLPRNAIIRSHAFGQITTQISVAAAPDNAKALISSD
jgi:hypothetical protein